jgi:hypothetical protein
MSSASDLYAKQIKHTEGKARRARTPLDEVAIWFDAWRRRAGELPPEYMKTDVDAMILHFKSEINRLKPGGDTK